MTLTESARPSEQVEDVTSTKSTRGISLWLSDKGIRCVLHPNRGMMTDINPAICQPIRVSGTQNWMGSFISPDIDHIKRSSELGGKEPTLIYMKSGEVFSFDGEQFTML